MSKIPAKPEASTSELNRQTIQLLQVELGKCHEDSLRHLGIIERLHATNGQLTAALASQAEVVKDLHAEVSRAITHIAQMRRLDAGEKSSAA